MRFDIYQAVKRTFTPTPKLAVDDWLRQNVRLERGPIVGAFDVRNSPWIADPLAQLRNHNIREILCACSVQSAKTAMAEGAALYLMALEGGDMGFYLQTDDHADEFLDTRFKYRIKDCKPVFAMLTKGERSIQKRTVSLANMTMYCLGAANVHNLQSKALRYVFGDEAAYWPHGHIDESVKRTTSFDGRNSKRVYISTPLNNSGEFYERFVNGSRSEWSVRCPECGDLHSMKLHHLKWDGVAAKLADGKYDLTVIKKTVRYECPACKTQLRDEPQIRRKLADSGEYVAMNPNPDPSVMSYHWNALTVPWVAWHQIAAEFLKAQYSKKLGDYSPLAEFVRKRLGEFWDLREFQTEEINLSGGFSMCEPWDREHRRYMTVDVQKDWFRVIIRLWAQNGDSRLYYAGTVGTWSQVRDLQEKHQVQPRRTFIDCGFERYTMEVYRQCAANGWIALMGDRAKFFTFTVLDRRTGKSRRIKRPYSQIEQIDSGVGLRRDNSVGGRKADLANRILWSSDYIKLILVKLRSGQGALWEVAKDAPKFYFDEIQNEVFIAEEDKKSGKMKHHFKKLGANHAFDAEAMQIVAACIEKIIGQAEIVDGDPSESGADEAAS